MSDGGRPGFLLGGRVRHDQRPHGHRTGIEPVLLAAAIPARSGDRVVEAGTGSGAGLLCLAARVPDIVCVGIERDPEQAALARANAAANGFATLSVITDDLAVWRSEAPFDHAFANPPWHDPAATPSPDAGRRSAKQAETGLLASWCAALAGALRRRGTLTLVLPAARLSEATAALLAARCGSLSVCPLWPRAGQPAKLILVQAIRDGRGPDRLLPGLVLHQANGAYTAEADAILRAGNALPYAELHPMV